jgi:hypothetical protein
MSSPINIPVISGGSRSALYFAYGANMNEQQISSRCGKARVVATARLPDHRLAFFGHSDRWDGGEETVLEAPGEDVHGVVYALSGTAFDRLDSWQRVRLDGTGLYFHSPAEVVGPDGALYSILLYKLATRGEAQSPSAEYLAHIVVGATARGLPPAYVEALAARPTRQASYPVPRPDETDRFLSVQGAGASCGG